LARRLADLFPKACFEVIESYKHFVAGKTFAPQDYNHRLETFFVVHERYDFFKACPCSNAVKSCGYHNVNLGFGCPFECSYCFLQNYTNAPGIVFPANLADFFKAFEGYRQDIRVGSGETTDSLAFDHITEFSPKLVEFFCRRPQTLFEFKTKSANVDRLLSVEAAPNIIVAWSVNPESVISQEEFFTASLAERLKAAGKCARAGYSTAFHFDPIVVYPGWERDYAEVVDRIFAAVPEEGIRWISLGTLRMTPEQKKMIENRFPENTILDAELLIAPDGKVRYHESVRRDIYRKMLGLLRQHTKREIIYLCMEPVGMWQDVGVRFAGADCRGGVMKEAVNRKAVVKKNLLKALAVLLILLGLGVLGLWAMLQFNFVTYKDQKEGIVIRYPRGWEVRDHPEKDVVAIFVAPQKSALQVFRENINFSTKDLSAQPLTIQQYAELVPAQMAAVFTDTVLEEKSFFNLSGHDAVKFVFHTRGLIEVMLVVYAFIYRDVAYNITYMGLADQYTLTRPKLEYVIRTVNLYF
jgi:spore photoproduct lyase